MQSVSIVRVVIPRSSQLRANAQLDLGLVFCAPRGGCGGRVSPAAPEPGRAPPGRPVACAAIVLTAEACVHDYARRGRVKRVKEKAPVVQALARSLFEHGVPSPS
jgi:hypothetical protein